MVNIIKKVFMTAALCAMPFSAVQCMEESAKSNVLEICVRQNSMALFNNFIGKALPIPKQLQHCFDNLKIGSLFASDAKPVGFSNELSLDGTLVLIWERKNDAAVLWDVATGTSVKEIKHNGVLKDATFSLCGKFVLTRGNDSKVLLWDVATGDIVQKITQASDNYKFMAAVHPAGDAVLTISQYTIATLWCLKTGEVLREFRHASGVNTIRFNHDGSQVLTACADRIAALWDIDSGECIQKFKCYTGWQDNHAPVYTAVFNRDGSQVLTMAHDGRDTAKIWSVATGKLLKEFASRYYRHCAIFSPDEKQILMFMRGSYMVETFDVDTKAWGLL